MPGGNIVPYSEHNYIIVPDNVMSIDDDAAVGDGVMIMMIVLTEAERILSVRYRPSTAHHVSSLQSRQL